jgi:hypothetical protein
MEIVIFDKILAWSFVAATDACFRSEFILSRKVIDCFFV